MRDTVVRTFSDVTIPLPEDISVAEVVGALTLHISSEDTPITTMKERFSPHNSWIERFDEDFVTTQA